MAPAAVFVDVYGPQRVPQDRLDHRPRHRDDADQPGGLRQGCAPDSTVGRAMSGNEVGLLREEVEALGPADGERRRQRAHTRLFQTGAHYAIDSIADLVARLDDIEARIARGERP